MIILGNFILDSLGQVLNWLWNFLLEIFLFVLLVLISVLDFLLGLVMPDTGAALGAIGGMFQSSVAGLLPYVGFAAEWFPFGFLAQALALFMTAWLVVQVIKWIWAIIP